MTTDSDLKQALAWLRQGDFAAAEACALQIVGEAPHAAPAWFVLGAARHRRGDAPAALEAFGQALALAPDHVEAARARATVLLDLQRPQEALSCIEAQLRRRPAATDFLVDAGIVLEALGDAPAAEQRYRQALRQAPQDFRARLNLAALAARTQRLDEALALYQGLVRSHAGSAAVHYNLADVLLRLDRYAESLAAVERALQLAPGDVNSLMLRGLALAMLERDAEATASFERAAAIDVAAAERYRAAAAAAAGVAVPRRLTLDPRQIRLACLLERQKACDWRERERLVAGLRALAADLRRTPAPLQEMGLYHTALSLPLSAAEQQALAQGLAAGIRVRAGAAPPPAPARMAGGKIRLGFISADFREHPAAQIHWRQLANHDRRRFEVFGYSLRDDGSRLRQQVAAACDGFHDVSALADEEIAARIALARIDILIDLSGYLDFMRPEVLALRPAPLQVSYLGFPATLGADFIDYRITDSLATPPEEAPYWSEALVFLPDTLALYNDREPVADPAPDRPACGLPAHGFVFCSFNTSYKIEPDAFSIWLRLLGHLPDSVLWLLDGGEAVQHNLRREALARGIAPQRLVFAPRLPRAEHLARHACADLFLDTLYCGAHTTAADALWAGLPVLTCPGHTMASRIGASMVRAAGLPELVAPDREAYEAVAFRLATQPGELAALREKLARTRTTSPMFDTARRVRELDHAFERMWQRHLAGLPPESFAVPREPGTGV